MSRNQFVGSVSQGLLYGAGLAAGTYAANAGTTCPARSIAAYVELQFLKETKCSTS